MLNWSFANDRSDEVVRAIFRQGPPRPDTRSRRVMVHDTRAIAQPGVAVLRQPKVGESCGGGDAARTDEVDKLHARDRGNRRVPSAQRRRTPRSAFDNSFRATRRSSTRAVASAIASPR